MELVRLPSPKLFVIVSRINSMVVAFLKILEKLEIVLVYFNYKNFFLHDILKGRNIKLQNIDEGINVIKE